MIDTFTSVSSLLRQGACRVSTHSGEVEPGDVFVALPAPTASGSSMQVEGGEVHATAAAERGASYIVCTAGQKAVVQAAVAGHPCTVVVVDDTRQALGQLAVNMYHTDVKCPKVVGLTGTNGKTTETYILEHIFASKGYRVGILGTIAYRYPGHYTEAPLTTPGCLTLHSLLHDMAEAETDYAFMEVSSHALDQDRIAGIRFSGALLTNVTQDHLDYHPGMEHYFESKRRLFLPVGQGGVPDDQKVGCCNQDDPYGLRLLQENSALIGYGLTPRPSLPNSQLTAVVESMTPAGMVLHHTFNGEQWTIRSPLVGGFNASNLLGAQALALGLGLVPADFICLNDFSGVAGRLERVVNSRGINAFIDYAHTPDALTNVLSSLRTAGFKRIVTVFGCGGNRDKTKRPLMGAAAAALSDVLVVTSDNPRFEEPERIIEDILPGITTCKQVVVEPDRRKALAAALEFVTPQDALLVAGKGHETYQIINGVKHPFSDMAILKEYLACI